MSAGRVTILSPHLDDAVLSCWHVLAGPDDVTVVNVFAGIPDGHEPAYPWWDHFTGAASSVERMRDRLAEDAEALALAGRRAVNLDFLDAQYRTAPQPVDAVADKLASVVDRSNRVYAPAALGETGDHAIVRSAAVRLERAGYEVVYYVDLPHAIRYGWPASLTGAANGSASLDVEAQWRSVLAAGVPDAASLVCEVRTFGSDEQAAKLSAIGRYRTQVAGLVALGARLTDPATLRHEAVWGRP